MNHTKKAFTLLELVISITISSIIIVIILSFVSDALEAISVTKKQTKFLGNMDNLIVTIKNYKNEYNSGTLLVDNTSTIGNDILILKNNIGNKGVIFGVVNNDSGKLENTNVFDIYTDKSIGYRELSASEITDLTSNPTLVYDYKFYNDKIYEDIKMKSFQVTFYNSGSLMDINFYANMNYIDDLNGESFIDVGNEDILPFNFVF